MGGKKRLASLAEKVLSVSVAERAFEIGQEFHLDRRRLFRTVEAGPFRGQSWIKRPSGLSANAGVDDLSKSWALARLQGNIPKCEVERINRSVRIVDLCSGAGGLATGVKWACEAVGVRPVVELAVDINERARAVYKLNLRPLRSIGQSVANLVDYSNPSVCEQQYIKPALSREDYAGLVGKIDIVLAGPPCEGNSNLNNHTRRSDRRNELYVATVATAVALDARVIAIENVAAVTRASQDVVPRSIAMLHREGYSVICNNLVLDASEFGAAQRRRRHFLIASKSNSVTEVLARLNALKVPPISALEAISDLSDITGQSAFDQPANLSDANRRRIQYLFEQAEGYDLPDSERPECHRDKDHTYPSVYGRMRPDEPSSTITTGFLSPGRGRYVHPIRPRSLTLHEGARLQGFPDDFRWYKDGQEIFRNPLAHLIGDAVPPQLGFAVGVIALSQL